MHIGIDVGGTNTDAVLMEGSTVVAAVKSATTADIVGGITGAISLLEEAAGASLSGVSAVAIGTTQFVNALVERRSLARTGVVRVGLPATTSVPPFADWPADLREAMAGTAALAHGGSEIDGRALAALRPRELREIGARLRDRGVESVAVCAVFSPVQPEVEQDAAAQLADVLGPEVAITLSNEIGQVGLLERENAAALNAALRPLADRVVRDLAAAVAACGITAPVYVSQNDGTLADVDAVRRMPILTVASGPTNSMRGAALLTGLDTCAVVDVGGTTSDVGLVVGGFPHRAESAVRVSGVRTNFRMPDVASLAIGGGTRIGERADQIGPDSVGFRIRSEGLVFGGSTLTATDIAVRAGRAEIGDPAAVAGIPREFAAQVCRIIDERVAAAVDRVRLSDAPIPVVVVGGGSTLLGPRLPGYDDIRRPVDFAVANAVGSAVAQVSGSIDRVVAMPVAERARVLDAAREEAASRAVAAGADPASVVIAEITELPVPYQSTDAVRVRVRAVGDLRRTT